RYPKDIRRQIAARIAEGIKAEHRFAFAVHVYAERSDAMPDAVFTVIARDEDEAFRLVSSHSAAGAHYRKQRPDPFPTSEVLAFSPGARLAESNHRAAMCLGCIARLMYG